MNLLSFNKTNPNLTVIPFKENKCTRSETQTYEDGRKQKESYPDVKKEEIKKEKKKKRREKAYLDVENEERKKRKERRLE